MYSSSDIDAFLNKITQSQNQPSKPADGTNSSNADIRPDIQKSILKDLIEQKVEYRHKVTRLVAELCKNESERHECVQLDFMSPLIDSLKSGNMQEKLESCRAIGNMCYENADGCELAYNKVGISTLFDVARFACETTETEAAQLRMIVLGALHNIVNSNEKVAAVIFQENMYQIFLLYVPHLSEPKIILFLFSICSNLIEHDTKCEKLIESHLLSELGNRITESDLYENRVVILPYLLETAEEDGVKEEICSSLLFYTLINLCEQYAERDEEFLRETCYLLVVLITTDKSIDRLLSSNKYDLLEYGNTWLEKPSLQLKMTGALIITNLTRSDQSAKTILSDRRKPDIKLVEQLKYFTTILDSNFESMTDEQAKAAHGILGALRNLAVPVVNRPILVEDDVFDNVIPYLFVKNFQGEIAYKATGVLRFLLRDAKETSKSTVLDDRILQQIVFNTESVHMGLNFESRRLLFLMPVVTKTSAAIEALARNNAFSPITSTFASCEPQANHGIIQNEATIALNLILMFANSSVCEKLKEANFHESMKAFWEKDIQNPGIVGNGLQLMHLILKQDNLVTPVQLNEYKPLLEKLKINQNCDGQRFIERLLTLIQDKQE